MPDPITWYILPKNVDDLTTIEEQIDADVLVHNQDPSAHGQSAESLYEHRVKPLIDHLNYSIYNIKQAPATRVVKAFVGPAGVGEFETIQEAIDYVNLLGGGRVFIKSGTYALTDHIVMYSNVHLEGESRDSVILDFNSNNKYFKVLGDVDIAPSGTISVTTDDATVTGAGSDFANEAEAGDYILINDAWYKIDSITDATHLELEGTYRGEAQAGLAYAFMSPLVGIKVENLTIRESGAIYSAQFYAIVNSTVKNIMLRNNTSTGVRFTFLSDCSVTDIYSMYNGQIGIHIQATQSTYFLGLSSLSNNNDGIQIDGNLLRDVKLVACNSSHNSGHGFDLGGLARINLMGCNAVGNDGNGFDLPAVGYSALTNCEAESNGGHGISLTITSNRNRIVACKSTNNGDDGIYIAVGAIKNIVTNNVVTGNTNEQIDDDAPDTIKDNNQVA